MSTKILRIYNKVDVDDIKDHLLVYGTLSASCAKCNEMGIKLETPKCPQCGTEFKFITFRNPKEHMPKMLRLSEEKPQIKIIDYDDYKSLTGKSKVEKLFND